MNTLILDTLFSILILMLIPIARVISLYLFLFSSMKEKCHIWIEEKKNIERNI